MRMIFRQTKVELLIAVVLFPFLFLGCRSTHYVSVITPQSYQHESKIPLNAAFYMDKDLKDKIAYWRLGPTRFSKTAIPIGDFVYKYSVSYLREGFRKFGAVDTLTLNPGLLIRVTSINIPSFEKFSGLGQADRSFNISVTFIIENSQGKEVFNEIYHQPGSLMILPAATALDQSTANVESVQRSFHFPMEKLLIKLMDDIQKNYKRWEL